jgi:Fe-S-cluster containining protein
VSEAPGQRPPAPPPRQAGNERRDLCAECGGQCCRTRPGLEAPERFLSAPEPAAALAEALASGDWVLAEHVGVPWVDGVEPPEAERRRLIRYPRPATLAERAEGAPSDALAPCTYLGAEGCRLAFEARPRMCRAVVPTPGFECEGDWGRLEAALAWLPHQAWVERARALAAARRGP